MDTVDLVGQFPGPIVTEQDVAIFQNDDVTVDILLNDANGAPFDFSAGALILTVTNRITGAPVLARQFTPGATGHGSLETNFNDAVQPGAYTFDVVYVAPGGAEYHVLPIGNWFVAKSSRVHGGHVTVPADSPPLGVGPQGPAGPTGPTGPEGPAGSGLTGFTTTRIPFATGVSTLADDASLAFNPTTKALSAASLAFPDGTTQKRGVRGPAVSVADFGAFPIGQFETNCNLAQGGTVVDMGRVDGLLPGMYVAIQGAGAANGNGGFLWHSARILSVDAVHSSITIDTPSVNATAPGGVSVIRQDNTPAIQAALDSGVSHVWMDEGLYWCNGTLRLRQHGMVWEGSSRGSAELAFPPGVPGLVIVSSYSADPGGKYGDDSFIRDMFIGANLPGVWTANTNLQYDYGYCVRPTPVNGMCAVLVSFTGDGHTGSVEPDWAAHVSGDLITDNHVTWLMARVDGITMYAGTCTLECVHEFGFAGDGIYIYGDPSGTPNSNTDLWELRRCSFTQNQNHGVHVKGGAANAGNAYSVSSSANNFYGFFDESDLGNAYWGCHTESNAGSYKATSGNGPTLFFNCYSEGGQTGVLITANGMTIGGEVSPDPASVGASINNGFYFNGTTFVNQHSPRGRKLSVCDESSDEQYLSFVTGDPVSPDSLDVIGDGNFAASYNSVVFQGAQGGLLAIPMASGAMKGVGAAIAQAIQLGQLNIPNIRTHVDPTSMTDKRRWLAGWECRNWQPATGNDSYTTICTRAGRGVPVWQALHTYSVGDMVHTVSNDGSAFHNLYFTCIAPGPSGASEPNWALTASNGILTDGTAQWQQGDRVAPVWAATTLYAVGDVVKESTSLSAGSPMWRCAKAGTSGGSEPSWHSPDAAPVNDNDVVWVYENDPLRAAKFETAGPYAIAARQVSAGAGLSGGGDLTADRTISMPNVGTPGAVGGGSSFIQSITTDAQGRVTSVVAAVPSGGGGGGGGGVIAQDDQDATGGTVAATGSFADVPGYTTWTVSPTAGTYVLRVRCRGLYGSGIAQFQVSMDGTPLVGSLGKIAINSSVYTDLYMTFPITMDGASHVFSIQWKALNGAIHLDQNFGGLPYGGREFIISG